MIGVRLRSRRLSMTTIPPTDYRESAILANTLTW